MLKNNTLNKKLRDNLPVMGIWNTLGSPLVTEVLARGGLDFIIIDMEHGLYDLSQVHLYVDKCEAFDCTPIVRLPKDEPWMILQALDQGAHGFIVPHVDTPEQASKIVESAYYHPLGQRGYSPFTKAGGFTNHGAENYSEQANRNITAGIIIESKAGLENLDDILKVDGIDVVYFGAYDLSQALGKPGDVRTPRVLECIQEAISKVRKANKHPGGFVVQSKEDIDWALDLGLQFITYQVDTSILYEDIRDKTSWLRNRRGEEPKSA